MSTQEISEIRIHSNHTDQTVLREFGDSDQLMVQTVGYNGEPFIRLYLKEVRELIEELTKVAQRMAAREAQKVEA
jgi:predicted YcjX-like family ATPase